MMSMPSCNICYNESGKISIKNTRKKWENNFWKCLCPESNLIYLSFHPAKSRIFLYEAYPRNSENLFITRVCIKFGFPKYTHWQKKRYNQNQSCFIQEVTSSNYVEINQHKLLAVSCSEGISNIVQRYLQTCVNEGRNVTSRHRCQVWVRISRRPGYIER